MALVDCLVLKKTPYRESSLIITGLNPDHGRLEFMVKGARRISKKRTPVVDLFRVIEVEYRENGRSMQSLYSAELIEDFSALAAYPDNFIRVCHLADFLTRNTQHDLACPQTYQAMLNILQVFAAGPVDSPLECLVKLVYLDENGFLPYSQFDDSPKAMRKLALLRQLLAFACGQGDMPEVSESYWGKFVSWLGKLIVYHQLGHG